MATTGVWIVVQDSGCVTGGLAHTDKRTPLLPVLPPPSHNDCCHGGTPVDNLLNIH